MDFLRQALVITFVLVGSVGMAAAQPLAGKLAIIPQVGLNIPTGDFGSTSETDEDAAFAKIGYCAGGAVEYYAIESLAIGGAVYYNRFGFDTSFWEKENPDVDFEGNWQFASYSLYLKYLLSPEAATRFFLRGGLALGAPKLTLRGSAGGQSEEVTGEADTAAGFDVAAGVQHCPSPTVAIFGEVAYSQLMTKDKTVTITTGDDTETGEYDINMPWFAVKIGVALFLGGK